MKPLYILLFLVFISCKTENKSEEISTEYKTEMQSYIEKLNKGRVNYLELIGLHKLEKGENSFGKSTDNNIALKANVADAIGIISIKDSVISLSINKDVNVTTDNNNVSSIETLELDEYGSSKLFYHNTIKFQIITRSGALYLRVWDTTNPYVNSFKGFETFPLNEKYIVNASFEYYTSEKNEEIETQLGVNTTTQFIGKATFLLNNEEYTLDVGTNGFTMVSDATSGNETYGGGRYIYFDLPKENGEFKIDFNKLYNPPCAFGEFTTCPLPPRQNRLSLKIEAGELYKKVK